MYSVEIKSGPGSTFIAKSKDSQFTIGIEGEGMTPPDTLLASLGSCIGVYIRKYAKGANFNLEDFTINLTAELTKEPPISFRIIKTTINLGRLKLDERRKSALLEFIKNCPVHNTLEAKPEISIEIV